LAVAWKWTTMPLVVTVMANGVGGVETCLNSYAELNDTVL